MPYYLNSFLARGDFSRLLITFAKSLDPDQDQQSIGPDQDPNRLIISVPEKLFLKKLTLKSQQRTTKA